VLRTVRTLRTRISERVPDAGLNNVCLELERVCCESQARIEWLAKPLWKFHIVSDLLLILLFVVVSVAISLSLQSDMSAEAFTFPGFVQTREAGVNDIVLISIAFFFVWTPEGRFKRGRAPAALHELRSIAHVIDMPQLPKDPDRLLKNHRDTKSSPTTTMNSFDLQRYPDDCLEMLSLIGKVAALHLQTPDDAAGVNEIEGLTTGLRRKIWQKVDLVTRAPED